MLYKIIIVNLKKREDRKNNVIKIFNENNITPYYFYEAIDGKTINLTYEIKNLFNGNDFNSRKGFIGCALSHYNIWIDLIKDKENNYYVIFEDDILLREEFNENFNKSIKFVNKNIENTDFLFMGYHRFNNENDFSIINFNNNNYIGGTFSYIITKKGAYKMLDYISNNGIKHGIDYLIKINKKLNIYELGSNIVLSEWVKNINDSIDSDIQKDFDTFNLNEIIDYNNYLFIKEFDQMNNDYKFIQNINIEKMIEISNTDHNIAGFNTLGFFKSNIDINNIVKSPYITDNHGIYINLDKIYFVKMICNWCDSKTLCNEWNNMCKEDYKWNNIKITDSNKADYYVIINKPLNEESYIPEKTIIFQMEPRCENESQKWGVKTWGIWADPDESKFLHVRTHKKYYNNCTTQLNTNYNEFMKFNIEKKHDLSTICSSKYYDPGHIKRIDFLKFIENKNDINIDIYGSDNMHNFKNYKYPLDKNKKDDGIIPYKYYFMIENNSEYNYITEKLWEPIICECLCFYWGAPNITDYIDKNAFVLLDMDDFEGSYNIIKNAINNNLWEDRIEIIKKEKYKILNYYNFYPTLERIITIDIWKNNLKSLINNFKIFILKKNKDLNHRILPFIYSLKEFGFNIDIFNEINKENIIIQNIEGSDNEKKLIHNNNIKYCSLNNKLDLYKLNYTWNEILLYENLLIDNYDNYLILDDDMDLVVSFNNLFNHMLYIPENYDICQLYENPKYKFRLINQHNSFYYNIKKYYFDHSGVSFISKKGATKILQYINNYIPYNSNNLIYECYENIENFNLYVTKNNQLFKIGQI